MGCSLPLASRLLGGSTRGADLATDRPNEGRELACDRGDRDVRKLASSDERPVTPSQAALRLPGDLANRSRCSRDLLLLLFSDPRRMAITPGALHQNTPCPPVAGLGDGATLDRIPGRVFRWHQTQICHQLAWRLKARQIA